MFVAIMGYGVVGSGTACLLADERDSVIKKSFPEGLKVKYILDLRKFPGDPFENVVTDDFSKILNDPEVKIVVETMGGLKPAYEYVLACLKAGKSVVTSNKELVAAKGYELLNTAKENNVNFMFEASVGGGIPIIRPLIQCLTANKINEIAGILNGTTNFILTKMITEGMSFDEALSIAQQLGYAEKNPTADVDGIDACRKICILAALSYGRHIYPDSVYTEGIRGITLADVEYAKAFDCVIKLIAQASMREDGRLDIMVGPALVKNTSQLASTNDVFNAVLVRGDALGDAVFFGRGAGKLPTASAVVADVIDCANHIDSRKPFGWDDADAGMIAGHDEYESVFYVRVKGGKDEDKAFGSLIYLAPEECDEYGDRAFITPKVSYKVLKEKLAATGAEICSVLRVTDY